MSSNLQRWLIIVSLVTSVGMLAVMAFGKAGVPIILGFLLVLLVAAAVLEYLYVIAPTKWYSYYQRPLLKPIMGLFCLLRGVPALPPLPAEKTPEPILNSPGEFRQMAQILRNEVCGQDRIVAHLVRRLETAVELRATSSDRPLGVFLFVGGEGIGKRYLANLANYVLFRGKGSLLEMDLNDGHAGVGVLNSLLGSGQNPSGLVKALRANPYGMVILENLDAANEPCRKVLAKLLRAGGFTDPQSGSRASFQNTLFVLTGTRGWEPLRTVFDKLRPDEKEGAGIADEWARSSHAVVSDATELDPLLLSRIHDVFCFEPPSDVVKMEVIEQLMKRECTKHQVELEWVDPQLVADQIFAVSPAYGFAPAVGHVERLLREEIKRARDQGRRRLRMGVKPSVSS